MVIQNDIPELNANRNYSINSSKLSRSLEKLSSGYTINRASDDAAGLAVSEKMRSQICGMDQAVRNCQDGVSLIQTFEGALCETVAVIRRAKTLADQMANGTYDDNVDRSAVEVEYLHLCDEIDQIAETDFNGVVMLSGKPAAAKVAELEHMINKSINNISPASFYKNVPQTASVSGVSMKAAAFAAPKAGGTVCGDLTVYGDSSDFSFSGGVLTILGGDVTVEGTGAPTTNTIFVAKDKSANVTLKNVNISGTTNNACAFKIADDSKGNVNIILEGDNKLVSNGGEAGIEKNCIYSDDYKDFGNLTISGNGSLYAEGGAYGSYGAGIGGGSYRNSYNIIIESGDITAKSFQGAGIGGGQDKNGGNIVINGGNIFASSECDSGIGGGINGSGEDITINGGNITAEGGSDGGAGIGGGLHGSLKNLTINGGTINASSISDGAGIGGGAEGNGQNIVINGGNVTAIGGQWDRGCSAGIGGGAGSLNGNSITITGGTVIAIGGTDGSTGAAGIGGSNSDNGSTIDISGMDTVVMAKGGTGAEDIGNGSNGKGNSTVNIDDVLTKEPYSGNGIVDGTIVHYNGNASGPSNNPGKPNIPDTYDKPVVSIPNAFDNAASRLTFIDKLILQAGARTKDAVNFTFAYSAMGIGGLAADLNCTSAGLGMDVLTLKTQESANYAIDQLDHALSKVSLIRSTFGAAQNRLEHKIDDLNNTTENLTASESRIRDTDIAQEMMNFTKDQILTQASQSMLAQANSLPQQVLSLIGG